MSSPVAAGGLVGIPAVTYRNGGTERASRIEFWYFLSPDPEITRDDNELAGGATISNLPPGAEFVWSAGEIGLAEESQKWRGSSTTGFAARVEPVKTVTVRSMGRTPGCEERP